MDEEINILCVDDESNVLKSLQRIFLDSDYTILTAPSGDEGLEILKETSPVQIVISDYRMPGMNGVDFLKEVYEHWPDTVRIVLSGYADASAIVGAINEGQIYKFMPKPWNDDELKVAISNALDHYFIRKKNIQLTKELEEKNKELSEINNNLEKIVAERTNDLTMRNKMLTSSQNILDSLPIGVMGIDPQDMVVQCNSKAEQYMKMGKHELVGASPQSAFPKELVDFINGIQANSGTTTRMTINNVPLNLKGVYMKYSTGQEGIILVLDEVPNDAE